MLNERELRALADECGVPIEGICSTCGRLAPDDPAHHFGHEVSRLLTEIARAPRAARPAPARRRPTPPAPGRPLVEWLTVPDISRDLGVSPMTVYRLINTGTLAGHRFGRSVRVSRAALVAYMTSALIAPPPDDEEVPA